MDYWEECIREAFEDAQIEATKEQIETVAFWVEGGHDNYSMACGYDCIPNPLSEENKRLERELNREKNKTICSECKGKGRLITYGPYHSSDSGCYVCRGSGFEYY